MRYSLPALLQLHEQKRQFFEQNSQRKPVLLNAKNVNDIMANSTDIFGLFG